MWSPSGPLQVGQIASAPASPALFSIFSLQARQMMWPLGQAGMGPLLGKCRHTGHSTMLLMSPTRLLSRAASSGAFFFDLLFVFAAVCLLSVFGSIFAFFFAGLDNIGERGAGVCGGIGIGRIREIGIGRIKGKPAWLVGGGTRVRVEDTGRGLFVTEKPGKRL